MKGVIVILLLGVIAGCGGGDNSSNSSSIVGVWITERCEQVVDRNGVLQDTWGKGLYEFTTQATVTLERAGFEVDGVIKIGNIIYSDSNCEVITSSQAPTESEQPVVAYQDLGEEVLQEGIPGHRFVVIFAMPDSARFVNGFYTINNGSLCFSDIFLSVFHWTLSFPTESPAIDFENCLVKEGAL